MTLKKWNELPVELRRSKSKRWDYLVNELGGGDETPEPSNSKDEHDIYNFQSYDDNQGTNLWGEGTVQTTGVTSDGYTEVEVLTNSTDQSFVGQKFFVTSDAETNGETLYQLYSDAGVTGTGIYVKISNSN